MNLSFSDQKSGHSLEETQRKRKIINTQKSVRFTVTEHLCLKLILKARFDYLMMAAQSRDCGSLRFWSKKGLGIRALLTIYTRGVRVKRRITLDLRTWALSSYSTIIFVKYGPNWYNEVLKLITYCQYRLCN